eukprot:gnl/MRDRNA2_/MRDRNA2_16310_c0_seq1.p1 gnl/MRDRNA2_/MRDRNA2_16310_c0~~gnl/MRDRNA2_/MRDRNA2_16310_c0_seq1.p1  ORF type:complete len:330 (+),score=26.92 gnl/MRDRNA2_/MRDRNA2_16310_c0_seq1:70-1059(+)
MGSDNGPAEKSLKRAQSVYALTPHTKWLAPTWAFPFFALVLLSTIVGLFFIDLSFETTRLGYTIIAVSLLIYRFVYYTYKQWLLYFIDLCYASTYALLASLWLCPSLGCSNEWQMAIFTVAQGAVAGAVFPLQTPLALHHPEAFESFYLHVSPMWVCYAVRWRFSTISTVPGAFELAVNAFQRFYLPWFIPYFIFLLLQPKLPECIAGLETLPDCQLRPGASHEERLELKRGHYVKVAKENFMAVSAHAVLSFSGFLAAGLAYQYHSVQVMWICCIMLTCIEAGYQFYCVSYDPNLPGNTIQRGFMKMGLAWVMLLASYMYEVRSDSLA